MVLLALLDLVFFFKSTLMDWPIIVSELHAGAGANA